MHFQTSDLLAEISYEYFRNKNAPAIHRKQAKILIISQIVNGKSENYSNSKWFKSVIGVIYKTERETVATVWRRLSLVTGKYVGASPLIVSAIFARVFVGVCYADIFSSSRRYFFYF